MHRRRRAARPIFTPARRPAGIPGLKGNRPCTNGLCRTRAELGRATRFSSLVAAPGHGGLISKMQGTAVRTAISPGHARPWESKLSALMAFSYALSSRLFPLPICTPFQLHARTTLEWSQHPVGHLWMPSGASILRWAAVPVCDRIHSLGIRATHNAPRRSRLPSSAHAALGADRRRP